MKSIIAVVGALLLPSFASANTGEILWSNLSAGMSKDEVRAIYPESVVELASGCVAKLTFNYQKNALYRVIIQMGGGVQLSKTQWENEGRCRKIVTDSLFAKYGDPGRYRIEPASKLDPNSYEVAEWQVPPVSIRYMVGSRNKAFRDFYTYAPDLKRESNPEAVDKL